MFCITAASSTAQVFRPNVFVTLVTWRRGRVLDAEAASDWLISDVGVVDHRAASCGRS